MSTRKLRMALVPEHLSKLGEIEAQTEDRKALLETGHSERVEGLVEGEAIHHCPVCGELGECYGSRDNYHSCRWCGSTWHSG